MLTEEKLGKLREALGQALESSDKLAKTVSKFQPQDYHHEMIQSLTDLISSIIKSLSKLPLQYLTDSVTNQIIRSSEKITGSLKKIDSRYQGSDSHPPGIDVDVSILRVFTMSLITHAGLWIPYLTNLQQDPTEGVKKIEKNVLDAEKILQGAKDWISSAKSEINGKKNEIEEIVTVAENKAAKAAIGPFAEKFETEAESLSNQSWIWLLSTLVLAGCTIGVAIFFDHGLAYLERFIGTVNKSADVDEWTIFRTMLSKLSTIAVFFTATLWCGRIYRAIKHQATINQHRALSLQTFEAFVDATDNSQVKDSVLMAATKTIFGTVPTGLVDQAQSGQDSNAQVVEIVHSSTKDASQAAGKASE